MFIFCISCHIFLTSNTFSKASSPSANLDDMCNHWLLRGLVLNAKVPKCSSAARAFLIISLSCSFRPWSICRNHRLLKLVCQDVIISPSWCKFRLITASPTSLVADKKVSIASPNVTKSIVVPFVSLHSNPLLCLLSFAQVDISIFGSLFASLCIFLANNTRILLFQGFLRSKSVIPLFKFKRPFLFFSSSSIGCVCVLPPVVPRAS